MGRSLIALALLVGCEGPAGAPGAPGAPGEAGAGPPDAAPAVECPPWTPPAGLGGPIDSEVSVAMAHRWLAFRDEREQERMWAAYDPARVAARYRIEQAWIDDGCVTLAQLVDLGRGLFLRAFTPAEGYGRGGPRSRVQRDGIGGPDASSCSNCHWKGGFAGSGDRADNAFQFGDGERLDSADERNPPALWGAGWTERVAAEMTAELHAVAARARESGEHEALVAKGVFFGRVRARPDGTLDTSEVVGVDPDLVVKPFGWKGTFPTIRAFVRSSLNLHLGMQARAGDDDEDGVEEEITEGQLSAMVAFLATLDPPRILVPDEGGARGPPLSGELEIVDSPEFVMRWLEGAELFGELGCADCHVPFHRVDSARYVDDQLDIDLGRDGAGPQPERREGGGWLVPVFSDFKRHAMGEGLAARHVEAGVPRDTWLTRRLWGVAQTRPYLHDGSAVTFDEAIARHGGEAARAREGFLARPEAHRASLRVFLLSLRRAPAIRVR